MAPRLSVVVAAAGSAARLREWLAALAPQLGEGIEVLVVHPAREPGVTEACRDHPAVIPLAAAAGALVPYLWRDGIRRAAAPRVALSVVHCRPGPGWIEGLLAADLERWAGVGGAIAADPRNGAAGWAAYLLRYARYAPPFPPGESADLPGDNALYDRAALAAHEPAWADGFWEPEVHARLRAEGRRLLLDPGLLAINFDGHGALAFACQRLAHGRRFGRDRAARLSPWRRLLYLLATPAVPLVFGLRVVRSALARPALRAALPAALPFLVFFLLAWAAGEAAGVADALAGRRE